MNKAIIINSIEEHTSILCELSDRIWKYAELSMQEYHSAEDYIRLLSEQGFSVNTNLAGIPTAFSGSFGSGKPVIGILGEFDALSGLSQKACVTHREALPSSNGHGCGHNLLGAASFGAAIAVKEYLEYTGLPGTVVFYGCPGEEGCAGKTFMARDGLFRDLDAALCWHPSDVYEVTTGSNAASLQIEYAFQGVSAHAAGDPENGRSALDAAELMNIGVQFLREHMDKSSSVHYAFTDTGGSSANVVPATAKLVYMVRGKTVKAAKQLLERVHKIAKGAAMMTGTEVSVRQIDGTANTISNAVLEEVLHENMCAIPLPEYTQEELAFAAELKTTCPASSLPGLSTEQNPYVAKTVCQLSSNGAKPLNDFLIPYFPSCCYNPGSTDVGDVSWLAPTAQFTAVTWVSGSPGHSWQNVSIGKSSIAHKGMLYAAKVLAMTACRLLEEPDLLKKAHKEFAEATTEGYDCPIGPEVVIPK